MFRSTDTSLPKPRSSTFSPRCSVSTMPFSMWMAVPGCPKTPGAWTAQALNPNRPLRGVAAARGIVGHVRIRVCSPTSRLGCADPLRGLRP